MMKIRRLRSSTIIIHIHLQLNLPNIRTRQCMLSNAISRIFLLRYDKPRKYASRTVYGFGGSNRGILDPIDVNSYGMNPKRRIDSSDVSDASDSTYASSRPLSYRDIRESVKSTPIVASVLADV